MSLADLYMAILELPPQAAEAAVRYSDRPTVEVIRELGIGNLPPLGRAGIREIEAYASEVPARLLAEFRHLVDHDVSEHWLALTMNETRHAIDHPDTYVQHYQTVKAAASASSCIPGGFPRPFGDIDIDPSRTRFEPVADAVGWMLAGAPYVIAKLSSQWKAAKVGVFRHHSDQNPFDYPLDPIGGGTAHLTVALVSDFGTGEYCSLHIARHLEQIAPDCVVHLGDVYYAGRESEIYSHLETPLAPLVQGRPVFCLNANHEMMAAGIPYFAYLDRKRQASGLQVQEGSYFCLETDRCQVIGIDTDFHERGRLSVADTSSLHTWLADRLWRGKTANPQKTNILLSQSPPYRLGKKSATPLYELDLHYLAQQELIDFWFWGDTHYAALFEKSPAAPFVGGCIGHGGFPIYLKHWLVNDLKQDLERQASGKKFADLRWVEDRPRFPEAWNCRPKMGAHGYILLTLGPELRVAYHDWLLNELRYETTYPL